jgi:hypothetical protein
MSPSELAELFEANPEASYRLTLSSGDVVDVIRARQALVGPGMIYVNTFPDPDARQATGTRIVSIVNIAMIEPFDPRRPRGRRARR